MRKSRQRLTIGVAVLAAAITGVTIEAVHASSPTPLTAVTIDGAGANPVLAGGHSLSYTGAAISLTSHDGGATVGSSGNTITLLPPTGGTLTANTTVATKTTADADDAGLTLTVGGVTCATGAGSVTIGQLTLDGSDITALAVSYHTTCGSSTASIGGEIRFNSTTDFIDSVQDVATAAIGSADTQYPSTTEQAITFHSVGSQATQFGAATIGGVNPGSFRIAANACSNVSLAPGATCQILVRAIPAVTGSLVATLSITTNATISTRTVTLTATGVLGHLGTYHPLTPARLLDTRFGAGAAAGPVGPGGSVHLSVSGHGGVPASGVMSVVLNVTEAGATGNSFLTVFPTGTPRPTASNLNFTPGSTLANSVTTPLSPSGQVDIYNSTGSVQLIADVTGYFVGSDALAAGGQYHPIEPFRLLDSRDPGFGPLSYEDIATPGFTYSKPDIDVHITALVVNITAVSPTASGWFTAYNYAKGDNGAPNSSTLNFAKGKNVANMAVVPARPCQAVYSASECGADYVNSPTIGVENFAKGDVHIIVDIMGYFDDGAIDPTYVGTRYHPLAPTRMVDTRSHLGAPGALTAGQIDTVNVPAALADANTWALATNVTAVAPTAATFLTVWPQDARPALSTLNPAAHQTVANAAYVALADTANQFKVYNNTGTTGLLVDVNGYYEYDPNNAPAVVQAQKSPGARPAAAPKTSTGRADTPRILRAH